MDLLNELEKLIQNYKNSKNTDYGKFVDLCCNVHGKYGDVKPGIIMILPKEWENSLTNALHIYSKEKPVYFEVINPFGVLDAVLFADVKEPAVYEKAKE